MTPKPPPATTPAAGEPSEGALDRSKLADQIATATAFLEALRDDYDALAELPLDVRQRFVMAAGQVARPGPWAKRALARAARAQT